MQVDYNLCCYCIHYAGNVCVFWQKEIKEMLGMTCGYFEEYSIEKKDDNEPWSGENVL